MWLLQISQFLRFFCLETQSGHWGYGLCCCLAHCFIVFQPSPGRKLTNSICLLVIKALNSFTTSSSASDNLSKEMKLTKVPAQTQNTKGYTTCTKLHANPKTAS